MSVCPYCNRDRPPGMSCANTRDMEDNAIDGDKVCFDKLSEFGGGEHGMRYVVLNRDALAFRRAQRASADDAQVVVVRSLPECNSGDAS